MAAPTISFARNRQGGSTEILIMTTAEAVKKGDVLVADESGADNNTVARMDDTAELPVGVALHDVASGEEVSFIPASPENIFYIKTSPTKKYVAAADRFTTCDFDTYTSGAMTIDPATDTQHHVQILGLKDGESDDTAANVVEAVFVQSGYLPGYGN